MTGEIWQYEKYKKTHNCIFGTLEISISSSSKAFETHTKIKFSENIFRNGILLPKLFWPIVWKNCSSDQEKLLKFEAEGQESAKFLRSLKQIIQTVKGQNNFW